MTVDPSAQTAAEPSPGRTSAPTVSIGETLGKYKLERVLGTGGMGMVWAAFDPDLERAIAIKLLHSSDEPTLRTRLLREARAMARLKHPNVLTVYEVGTDKNRDYIAMEIVDGTTLDGWLETRPPRAEIIRALLAAGRGLAAAHAAGLVHRDFKPHNVLRSKDGHVYVTDFGLARGQIEDGAELEHVARPVSEARTPDLFVSPLTQTGVMIGTPAYMAPEQFQGKIPDPRTDQFAFCVTAWEALVGKRPFRGETLPELEAAVTAGAANLEVDLPPRLRAVLVRGLDPTPSARWPDVPALLEALAATLEPDKPRSRYRALTATLAIGAVLIAVGTGIYVATRSTDKRVVTPVIASDCDTPDTAFDSAWSPARRDEVAREIGGDAHDYFALFDQLRKQWTTGFRNACALPDADRRRAALDCLAMVRKETERVHQALVSKTVQVSPGSLGQVFAMLAQCQASPRPPIIIDVDENDLPEPPEKPEPPGKPEPPRPMTWER